MGIFSFAASPKGFYNRLTIVIKNDNLGDSTKKIELLRELEKRAVFGNKEIKDLTGKDGAYTKLIVYRLKRDGLIKEIERDKYTVHDDPFLVASKIVWPSYISCWAA
ncbi:MAG: hypothetical protein AB1744_15160, partial [Candidatus Zixiibacteriota bacterium]